MFQKFTCVSFHRLIRWNSWSCCINMSFALSEVLHERWITSIIFEIWRFWIEISFAYFWNHFSNFDVLRKIASFRLIHSKRFLHFSHFRSLIIFHSLTQYFRSVTFLRKNSCFHLMNLHDEFVSRFRWRK